MSIPAERARIRGGVEMFLSRTLVLRQCLNCRRYLGFGVWPWTGEPFTVTHGLCRSCFKRLEAAAAD